MSEDKQMDALKKMISWQGIDVNVMASTIGALAAQEIVKVVSGKNMPFRGLMAYSMETAETI